MFRSSLAALVGACLMVAASGCARHVIHHHPARTVVQLEEEHHDKTVVIVQVKPRPRRHCWKHHRHWHCRR